MRPISDTSFNHVIRILQKFIFISVRFKSLLRPMLLEKVYDPDVRILHFKETQELLWFMLDGLAREIRVDVNSRSERTIWFWFPFSFIYTTPGFFNQNASNSTIEILKESLMVYISYDNWFKLKRLFKEADKVTESIRGENEQARLLHEDQIKYMTTEERYLQNIVLVDKLFALVKRKFIAEFMMMSIDRLSKLRTKY